VTVSDATSFETAGPAQTITTAIVALGMIATIGSALAFEHIGGYAPCALCLEQRNPYYWGIPFLLVGLLSALMKWPACLTRGMLMIGFVCLLATIALGVYHSGVEWGIFEAPATCGAGLSANSSDAGSLFDDLATALPPSCDKAAGRFLGISFANANVIAAVLLALVAYRGAFGKPA